MREHRFKDRALPALQQEGYQTKAQSAESLSPLFHALTLAIRNGFAQYLNPPLGIRTLGDKDDIHTDSRKRCAEFIRTYRYDLQRLPA